MVGGGELHQEAAANLLQVLASLLIGWRAGASQLLIGLLQPRHQVEALGRLEEDKKTRVKSLKKRRPQERRVAYQRKPIKVDVSEARDELVSKSALSRGRIGAGGIVHPEAEVVEPENRTAQVGGERAPRLAQVEIRPHNGAPTLLQLVNAPGQGDERLQGHHTNIR